MSVIEKKIVPIIFFLLFLPMLYMHSIEWFNGYGDNAFLGELINNISNTGKPSNQINASVYNLFTFLGKSPAEVLKRRLDGPDPKKINQFKKHTYLILYLISPLTYIMPDRILIPGLKILSFLSMIFLIYYFLRSKGVDIVSATIFCLFISSHPVWSYGLYGQMYVDRLFLPLGTLFLFTLTSENIQRKWLLIISLLCFTITDRVGAICGMAIICFTLLNWKKYKGNRVFLFSLAGALILGSLLIIKFYMNNSDYGSFSSSFHPRTFLNLYETYPGFSYKLHIFIFLNFLFFGFFGFFDLKTFLVAIILMIPNIMGNIGGAEKTGWYTHYHMLYFPFLVWALANGYIKIYKKFGKNFSIKRKIVFNASICVLLLFFAGFYPYSSQNLAFDTKNLGQLAWIKGFTDFPSYLRNGHRYNGMQQRKNIEKQIPRNVIISTMEPLFTTLYKDREIHIYPAGIDIADYLILNYSPNATEGTKYTGAASYAGPEAIKELDIGLNKRMVKLGFDVDNPIVIGPWAILEKKVAKTH